MTFPSDRSLRTNAVVRAFVLVHDCAINPVSGDREYVLVSEGQEIAMGAEGAESVSQSIGLVDDEAVPRYVQGLGMNLAGDSERPHLPWSFIVLDDPKPKVTFLSPGV